MTALHLSQPNPYQPRLGRSPTIPPHPAWLAVTLSLLLAGCTSASAVDQWRGRVMDSIALNPDWFTQGLAFDGRDWLLSSGRYGHSRLLRLAPDGAVQDSIRLNDALFAEGLALQGGQLYLLTWRSGRGFVHDPRSLACKSGFTYRGQGWGLASDGKSLWRSDGSATITRHDPASFQVLERIRVTLDGEPLDNLNELEWVDGRLYANVWHQTWLAVINPATGRVTGQIHLDHLPLKRHRHPHLGVLNGIALRPTDNSLWITGKHWSVAYRIELVPRAEQ